VGSISQVEPNDFDRPVEVNVKSVYLLTGATAAAAENPLLDCEHWLDGGTSRHQTALCLCTTKGAVLAMTQKPT